MHYAPVTKKNSISAQKLQEKLFSPASFQARRPQPPNSPGCISLPNVHTCVAVSYRCPGAAVRDWQPGTERHGRAGRTHPGARGGQEAWSGGSAKQEARAGEGTGEAEES